MKDCVVCGAAIIFFGRDMCDACLKRISDRDEAQRLTREENAALVKPAPCEVFKPLEACFACGEPLYIAQDGRIYEHYTPAGTYRSHTCPATD